MPEERKLVTVLFADVTGSTALGEDLDPEDVRALMGRYYEHARQVVSDHGGTLEKFIGDAVMAVFGLPHAHGDDAERAVAAALALQNAVREDSVLGERVMLRLGVNTGEVIATSDPSSGDFLVTGDAVNVAARLQQSANPGEILASDRTCAATGASFLFGEKQQAEVKGKSEPLRVFPVAGVRPVRQVERPSLVGRQRELAQLSLLQSWALEERRPQLLSIIAPAGTGKTRLLEELLAGIDRDEGWKVATGRCLPYGQTLTYWPLRSLLQDLVSGIDRERVVDAFARGGLSAEDSRRLTDLVFTSLGIESERHGTSTAERESIFNAWRLLVEVLAKEAPRIVIFEDLHWASESLLDLVEHIMQPRTQAPLLIVATSRPELLDRRRTWGGGGRQSFTALVLQPLNEDQTAQLVRQLGEEMPELVRQRIVERSGGNPFFVTELVRGLKEHSIKDRKTVTDVVPDTVHAAVLARLDLLLPQERMVLQAAAVGGRAFRPATLQAVLEDMPPSDVDAALDALLTRDLIVPDQGGAFTFRHILIRDVAYGTLSRVERIRMHAAVAGWLEEYAADRLDQFVELIAFHYREAVTLSRRSTVPLALPFDPATAVGFLERAGELAGRVGALTEARAHLESAIAIAPVEQHVRLYEKLGDCVIWGDVALDAYRRGLVQWREEGSRDPLVGARLLRKFVIRYSRSWGALTTKPEPEEVGKMAAEAQRLAEEAGDEDELRYARVAALWWACLRHRVTGEDDVMTREEAEEGYRVTLAAAAHFEQRQDWRSFSETLDLHPLFATRLGRADEVIESVQRRLAVPTLPLEERGDALAMLAWTHLDLGRYDRVIDAVREALAQVRPGDPIAHLVHAVALAADAAFFRGRWSEIEGFRDFVEEARQQLGEDSPVTGLFSAYVAALQVALAREDRAAIDAAASALSRVLDLATPGVERREVGRGIFAALMNDDPLQFDLDLAVKVLGNVAGTLGELLMFLNEHGVPAPEAFISKTAARARAEYVGVDRAIRFAETAHALAARDAAGLARTIDEAERHGLVPHAARMRIVLAEMTRDPAPLEQARPVLERLEDRQYMRRLEEVAASLG